MAHIGVIEVLEKNGINIDYIAGSSAGAVIGGIYAATKDIKVARELISSNTWKKIFDFLTDFAGFNGGIINGKKMADFLRKNLAIKNFEELQIPFCAVATNIENGETEVLDEGDFFSAIQASFSIPVLFKPLRRDGKLLVDGGLSQPVPVRVVKKMGADIVIGVNLDHYLHQPQKYKTVHIPTLIGPLMDIARFHLAEKDAYLADIQVEPRIHDNSLLGIENFLDGHGFIEEGQKAMEGKIPELKKLIEQKNASV
ncbi:MAG: patatin-like phospholipase family protein [Candidatus Magasanikbacteria bacterium]|nr:patatin-like phospholipase family protein [Candidatus Magasanikbacteria bacterium]